MSELPAGTVAFLFTDVEGSTRLLQAHPRAYPRAIARHHEILASAVADQGGVVFETVGDAVYASFARTEAAARAAVAGQRRLAVEDWDELGALRVRMGIHTGDVELHGEHYFGPALYRCARIMAAASGGQVLVSEVAAGILRDAAPDEIALRDLGAHRLKDLQRAERLFQLDAPGLVASFAPPRTLETRPHNLPLLATPTIGRARELAEARAIVLDPATRMLTLTGPGGTGKTRLALVLAADVLDHFADGAFFVPLAPITDAQFVVPAIASVLDVRESAGRSLADAVRDHLRERRLLLVLDNFEHLVDAAPHVADLLAAAPLLRVLATSQAPLRIYGEREYRLPPMSTAAEGADPDGAEAVQLFLARCREIRSDIRLTAADVRAALAICQRLDGLPLAIELAAARTRSLAPVAILERLDRRLELLTSGPRDAPQRQRTLRATLAWSHDLLSEPERRVFRRLSVFSGGCELAAAEHVVGSDGSTLDALESLVEKSLLDTDGRRFSMLESVREFAREQLEAQSETAAVQRRHAEYYAELAQEAEPQVRGHAQLRWLSRLDTEREDLRAALTWALSGEPLLALLIAHGMCEYWFIRGEGTEARRWLEAVLTSRIDGEQARRALVGAYASFFATQQGDAEHTRRRAREALALARSSGDTTALVLASCVHAYAFDGPLDEAAAIAASTGDPWLIGFVATYEGERLRAAGQEERAVEAYERAVDASRRAGDGAFVALNATNLGHMYLRRGDLSAAEQLLTEALRGAIELGDWATLPYALNGLAGVQSARGAHARAAQLLGWVDSSLGRSGDVLADTDRVDHDRTERSARSALGAAEFERAWQEGSSLSRDAAIALATRQDD